MCEFVSECVSVFATMTDCCVKWLDGEFIAILMETMFFLFSSFSPLADFENTISFARRMYTAFIYA